SLIQVTQGAMLLNRLQRLHPQVFDNLDIQDHAKIANFLTENGPGQTDIDVMEFVLQVIKGWT
ncbi:MAG: hypothetical protein ACFFFG_18380, partial [Candidatus Thorarchaeota archaeon]